jgi:FdhD protein
MVAKLFRAKSQQGRQMIAELRHVSKWDRRPRDEAPMLDCVEEWVAAEVELSISIDGSPIAAFSCSPESQRELVVGFLRSEGLIEALTDIDAMLYNAATRHMDVRLTPRNDSTAQSHDKAAWMKARVRTSGCAHGVTARAAYRRKWLKPLPPLITLSPERISALQEVVNRRSASHRETGCLHHAALVFADGDSVMLEDVGRHNAVDKVIGAAMLAGFGADSAILVSSGRLSSEIVLKAATTGIRVVISRAAPTTASVDAAQEYGITLIGFARAGRFNVYTHADRIDWGADNSAGRLQHTVAHSQQNKHSHTIINLEVV